jgi:ABC-type multidrug transport system ATPase subunit
LSLRVPPGRCYGFFGRNGAGKTTTIRCLLNLLRHRRLSIGRSRAPHRIRFHPMA